MAVHPHARGEHAIPGSYFGTSGGSSPRAWGTPKSVGRLRGRSRFIPTRVGNTPHAVVRSDSGAVHPHARGEHRGGVNAGGALGGSSPRAWGTPALGDGADQRRRFIPTRVGNT